MKSYVYLFVSSISLSFICLLFGCANEKNIHLKDIVTNEYLLFQGGVYDEERNRIIFDRISIDEVCEILQIEPSLIKETAGNKYREDVRRVSADNFSAVLRRVGVAEGYGEPQDVLYDMSVLVK